MLQERNIHTYNNPSNRNNVNFRFSTQVTFKALQQRTLRLSVFDVDRSKKHRLIGHAMYPLKDLDYETHQKVVMWLDLEKEVNEVIPLHI